MHVGTIEGLPILYISPHCSPGVCFQSKVLLVHKQQLQGLPLMHLQQLHPACWASDPAEQALLLPPGICAAEVWTAICVSAQHKMSWTSKVTRFHLLALTAAAERSSRTSNDCFKSAFHF